MKSIEIRNLNKSYGDAVALKNVSVNFEEGKIYGLLGRNGAGKSTLLKIISGRIFANSGEVVLNGETMLENEALLSQIYMMSEETYYPDTINIKSLFEWTNKFYPLFDMSYAVNLANQFELSLTKKVKELSTGFNSILKLIIALSVNTQYVFLDEPVLGLDANNRDLFYKLLLEKYSKKPFTIVLSTHLIEEISAVIENIIIIKNGEILRSESRDELVGNSYSVSGLIKVVDAFTANKKLLGADTIGGLKTAYVLGSCDKAPDNLVIAAIELQKLFILMTNSKEAF